MVISINVVDVDLELNSDVSQGVEEWHMCTHGRAQQQMDGGNVVDAKSYSDR
jgi:hypothetical protein